VVKDVRGQLTTVKLSEPRGSDSPPYDLHLNDPPRTVEDLKILLYGTWEVEGFAFPNKVAGNISPAIIRGGIIGVRDWRGGKKKKKKKTTAFPFRFANKQLKMDQEQMQDALLTLYKLFYSILAPEPYLVNHAGTFPAYSPCGMRSRYIFEREICGHRSLVWG